MNLSEQDAAICRPYELEIYRQKSSKEPYEVVCFKTLAEAIDAAKAYDIWLVVYYDRHGDASIVDGNLYD